MKRLTIHLHHVERKENKTFNTVSHLYKSEKQKEIFIAMYGNNIAKYQTSNLK